MRIIAHRGYSSQAPENTMAAFERVVSAGFKALELDVQMTKDSQVVVIHDETIDRTSDGQGLVKEHSYEELTQYDFGAWFGRSFAGERLPLLADVLDLVQDHDLWVNVELKTGAVAYPGLEDKVITMIRSRDLGDQTLISSFNHYSLKAIKELWPELPIGVLYMAGLYEPWNYARTLGAEALHPYYVGLTPELVRSTKARGLLMHPFTVDKPADIQAVIASGADGIITNYPERVQDALAQKP